MKIEQYDQAKRGSEISVRKIVSFAYPTGKWTTFCNKELKFLAHFRNNVWAISFSM